MKKIKILAAILCATCTLAGCSNNAETSDTSDISDIPPEYVAADIEALNSNVAEYYMKFLKYGGMSAEEISAEEPQWVFTSEDDREMWEIEVDDKNREAYSRSAVEQVSSYACTFPINTSNVQRWINVELTAIDNLLNCVHTREKETGYSWVYKWSIEGEAASLHIYSTGVTGEYVGLVSFTRQGYTSMNQMIEDIEASNALIGEVPTE